MNRFFFIKYLRVLSKKCFPGGRDLVKINEFSVNVIPAKAVVRKVYVLHPCHAEFISASILLKGLWILKQVQNDKRMTFRTSRKAGILLRSRYMVSSFRWNDKKGFLNWTHIKKLNYFFMIGIFITVSSYTCNAQCGCSSASMAGIVPTADIRTHGFQRQGNFRVNLYYDYLYGDTYFTNDNNAGQGKIKYFTVNYLNLLLGYNLTDRLAIEGEIGYYPQKTQDQYFYNTTTRGFSHTTITAKYNLFRDIENNFEFTLGAGGRIPLGASDSTLPQHIQSSTGAYGLVVQSLIQKVFEGSSIHFYLFNRFDYNASNSNDYQYGSSIVSSLFATRLLLNYLRGIIELRNECRFSDKLKGNTDKDTGGFSFTLSPQLNFIVGDFNISAIFDYPFYQFYNGSQLGKKYSIALNLSWSTNLIGHSNEIIQ